MYRDLRPCICVFYCKSMKKRPFRTQHKPRQVLLGHPAPAATRRQPGSPRVEAVGLETTSPATRAAPAPASGEDDGPKGCLHFWLRIRRLPVVEASVEALWRRASIHSELIRVAALKVDGLDESPLDHGAV